MSTPTREQVIEWAATSSLSDRLRLDSEASRILGVQCLERFAALAMSAGRDQGLREAKEVCEHNTGTPGECAAAIEQLRGK